YRERSQIDPVCCKVFGKVPVADLHALAAHALDVLIGKQGDLAMPVPRVRVPDDAMGFLQHGAGNRLFLNARFGGDIDGEDGESLHPGLSLVFSVSRMSVMVICVSTALHMS